MGKGESQVLSWAYRYTDFEAVVDDRAARNCAAVLGIRVCGTLGDILLAKQEGKISAVKAVFDDLRNVGLRIDGPVLERALRLAGE